MNWGSPPRMRGKVTSALGTIVSFGITPAYAGKSRSSWASNCRSWDHPRVCGEKLFAALEPAKLTGSPPRMRGKGPEGARP